MERINMKQFVDSYLATAAWVTCDSTITECTTFTKASKEIAKKDCEEFIELVIEKFGEKKGRELLTVAGNDLVYLAPHCFFLNRNGHGTGFWNRENEFGTEEALILSDIAKEMGGCDCMHERGPKSKLIFC